MRIDIDEMKEAGVTVVAPVGRIDSTTSEALDRQLSARVAGGDRRIVIDFSGVEYISSAGLRVMLTLAKKLRDLKGQLALAALGDSVRQVFELAGFLPLFAVEPTREAARQRVAAS
jgi:anti-anti-sigma factor